MNVHDVKRAICGPMIPVITNLRPDLSIDHDAITANVRYVIDHGIHYGQGALLAVGAGGDFPSLSLDERKEVTRTIIAAANGEAPVIVGAQDTNPATSVEIARFAERSGAYAIQLSPTYYYEPSDEDVQRLYRSIHDATDQIAIMVYNTWWHGYNMPLGVVDRLCELERIVSLKWSTPDGGASYQQGVARFADRLAVIDNNGLEVLNHMLGGTGFITHLATVWPEHDVALFQMLREGRFADALAGFKRVNWPWGAFRGKIWTRSGGESNVVKAALEIVGRPGGPNRPPTRGLTDDERTELRQLLRTIGVPGIE